MSSVNATPKVDPRHTFFPTRCKLLPCKRLKYVVRTIFSMGQDPIFLSWKRAFKLGIHAGQMSNG